MSAGRIFGKVNIVDLIVLIVIVAVVVFAVVRTTGDSSTTIPVRSPTRSRRSARATVDAITKAVQAGATVRDDGGTELWAIVVEARCIARREGVPTPEGELKAFDSPVFSDVDIVVQGQGTPVEFDVPHRQCPHEGRQEGQSRRPRLRGADGDHAGRCGGVK